MEELLFRGALLHAVWSEHGVLFAILANSIIFGLHHVAFGINAILAKMTAGFLWSLLVLLGGSIIAAVVAHPILSISRMATIAEEKGVPCCVTSMRQVQDTLPVLLTVHFVTLFQSQQ